jgi:hypothetical protein
MSDEWRYIGSAEGFLGSLAPPHKYLVENRRTGERRVVWAHNGDDIGRAIAAGNWAD